jgi:hypothetical protein
MAISSSFLQNYDESAQYYIKALQYANNGENKFIIIIILGCTNPPEKNKIGRKIFKASHFSKR